MINHFQGPLLKHILEQMRDGSDSVKMYLYGTHDINIVNTLRAMGFTEELFKLDLGVSLIYELRAVQGGQTQEVRVSIVRGEFYSIFRNECFLIEQNIRFILHLRIHKNIYQILVL